MKSSSSTQSRTEKTQRQNRSFVGRTNTRPMQSSLFLTSLLILFLGEKSSVLGIDENSFADPDSAFRKCQDAYSELWSSNENLGDAFTEHEENVDISLDETDWTIGYSEDAKNAYKSACDEYNEFVEEGDLHVFWMDLNTSFELVCDWPQKDITGRSVEFYGIGSCLANTSDCREWDSMDLVMPMWANTEGIDCRALDTASTEKDEGADSENGDGNIDGDIDGDGEGTENLAPGDQEDSSERLPFLTDEDVKCIDGTADFVNGIKGLSSAQDTFESSQFLKEEDSGVEIMGYPEEAAKAMKSGCELHFGTWAFVKSSKFTCVIKGMETIAMHVHNYGKCLATIEECVAMDPISLLRVDLAGLGFNCWEDEEAGGDESSAASTEDNQSTPAEDSESGTHAEQSDDTSGSDAGTTSEVVENSDVDDSDESTNEDTSDGNENENISDIFGDLGVSESDQQCMNDSVTMTNGNPELEKAEEHYAGSIEIENSSVTEMTIGFSDEDTNKLKTVCDDDTIGGYFSLIKEQEFVCTMMSVEVKLKITNIANCLANTDECKNMNPLLLMEDLWQSMGLSCEEEIEGDDKDTTDTTEPDDSNKGDDKKEPGEDDSLFKALGLSESEVACMSESTTFIDDSAVLSNATEVYEKSVQMTDPTKLGYTSASASEMEQVCEEQGGIWSFIESEDVTCTIKGRDRCINVYNFGNCIASNSDCQSMDPFVLVRGFFLEVLGFSCRAKCNKHTNAGGHSSEPHNNRNPNDNSLASKQNPGTNSGSGSKLPSFTTAAVVLGVVASIGLVSFFRYRASRGIDRNSRSSYEMTDISDLGFQVFT